MKLAKLTAKVAMLQLVEGRYFLIENPAGSDLFNLPEFQTLWATGQVGKIIFPQCTVGLETPDEQKREPIFKETELWANDPDLLTPF